MTDAIVLFRDALQAAYGPLDWLPVPDGAIHRFRVPEDKPGTLNGWYVLYLDGIASGAFGSWKSGSASIRDDGGELAARDADVGRRGNYRIARKGGRSLDDMATQAAEAGYLGNVPTATPEILLASLDKELRGQH